MSSGSIPIPSDKILQPHKVFTVKFMVGYSRLPRFSSALYFIPFFLNLEPLYT